jgi:protein phosphatase
MTDDRSLLLPLSLRVAARTDPGPRAGNEDRHLVARFDRSATILATDLDESRLRFVRSQSRFGLAVADGMGGHAAGEVASTLALSLALQYSQQGTRWYVRIGEAEMDEIFARATSILHSVDDEMARQAAAHPHLAGMGTTFTVAVLIGDCLVLCHVGDSRAYLLSEGHLARLTRDHNVAAHLVAAGLLPADKVGGHRTSRILTRVLGRGQLELECSHLRLADGDRLLLATDGLTEVLTDADIARGLAAGDCRAACDRLVEAALERSTSDNVTVIVADVDLP